MSETEKIGNCTFSKLQEIDHSFGYRVRLENIEKIIRYHNLGFDTLKKLNPKGCYNGDDLTIAELIYQVFYEMSNPNATKREYEEMRKQNDNK